MTINIPGEVLELASGSGAHINYFAPHFKQHNFQPSDYDTDVFETIKTTRGEQGNTNVADPVKIDLTEPETWPDPDANLYDVVFVINLFQVAPVSIIDGIAQVAARVLKPSGFLAIYGPFKVDAKYQPRQTRLSTRKSLPRMFPNGG